MLNPPKNHKNSIIQDWHMVRKEASVMTEAGIMKWKFTYKELTLLLGILVAVIIMLTLWLRPTTPEANEVVKEQIPSLSKPVASILLQKTFTVVTESLKEY
jgi:hypothetical protein